MDFEEYANRRVLIVDDQREIHDDFAEMLKPRLSEAWADNLAAAFVTEEEQSFLPEFELLHARSGEEAFEIVRTGKERSDPVAVAYIDIRMPPGIDGIETIRRVREVDRDVEIVLMTAYTDRTLPEIIQNVEPLHKVLYIRKPFAREEIQQITLSLVGKWNIEQALAEKRRQLAVNHKRLEAVLDATGEAMAMYDLTGRLLFANRGYQRLTDLTESELRKLSPDALTAQLEERFREPDLHDVKARFVFKDGGDLLEESAGGKVPEQRLFYRSTAPVRDGQGEVMGSLFVYRDVSKEVEAERMKAEVLRLRNELETTYSFEGIIGASPPMQQVYTLMKQAAESDITVLIRGESGTGKELVARSFHFNSPRKDGPFLAINCAAIPETLMESELFGHERGAFTGATRQRIGAFERAKGGTILLDEIGDMQPALQAKLLRVLQEREIQRVGGGVTLPIDLRVIVATNKDLEAAVKAGEFRQDLFYRISAFPIVIPPLRERRMDIPLLANHFLNKHAESNGRSMSGISAAALRLLLQYDWPGNVRELDNAIERAVLLEKADVLQVESLPPHLSVPRASAEDHSAPAAVFMQFGTLVAIVAPAAWVAASWSLLARWDSAKRKEFIKRFPEIVDHVVRLTRAGLPAVESVSVVSEEAPEPVKSILKQVSDDLSSGLDPEVVLRGMAARLRIPEFTLFSAALCLQRSTGGGISGALGSLSSTLRARLELEMKAHASTAQTRITLLVLSGVPVLVLGAQSFTNPAAVDVLFESPVLLRWGVGLIVAGLLIARGIAARFGR